MQDPAKYLKDYFDLETVFRHLNSEEKRGLPLYLKASFDLYRGAILGADLIWAAPVDEETYTPEKLQKQGLQLRQLLNSPVVFVLDKLASWQRKRLIERKISFIQPGKQLYVPDLLLHLDLTSRRASRTSPATPEKLSMPAQCIALYHLEVSPLEQHPLQKIADQTGYSAMTVSRVVKEFTHFGIASLEGTRVKSIRFSSQGRSLWNQLLPICSSPVRDIWYADSMSPNGHWLLAGENALSAYTLLSEGDQLTYAVGKTSFRTPESQARLQNLNDRFGDIKIEVWHYAPELLSAGKEVDKLSLYLSMQHEEDERIKGALDELLNGISW